MKTILALTRPVIFLLSLSFSHVVCAAEKPALSALPSPQQDDLAGHTPLHLAALRNDADAVDALLARGADANATNQYGATPLHYATGSERMVTALLAHGARPDVMSKSNRTPLMSAIVRPESFAVARRLVEAGASVNIATTGATGPRANAGILSLSILGGDRRTIDFLLQQKAEVNSVNFPPLSAAAQVGDVETARRLIEAGADLNKLSANVGPALNLALFNGHIGVARLLVERGADLKVTSVRGYATPPMVLSGYNTDGDATIARLLVARGIDVNTANEAGETALSFALKDASDNELIRFLRSAGAKSLPGPAREKTIPARLVPAEPAQRSAMLRESAQRAIDALQSSSTRFLENKRIREEVKCITCHQQSLPAIAFGWARDRGLRVDEHELGRQLSTTFELRKAQMVRALELDQPTPGATVALGHDADGLRALRYPSDEIVQAMSRYLLEIQRPNGSWTMIARRVPMEEGPIDATAWSARAVQLYPPKDRQPQVDEALRRARTWLSAQKPHNENDRVFQLLGLAWSNETQERMRPLADELAKNQRADGGWAQMPDLASDAWATGSALVALHKAGLPTSNETYRRGVEFLLRTQFDDGSWWVRSRTWPFQPHFDTGFPHGKDQWISAAGTAWATMALLLTLEPISAPEALPNALQMIAAFQKSPGKDVPASSAPPDSAPAPKLPMDFLRDIRPIFERSCIGCHDGAKPKGGFVLANRDDVLKGGQSGEAAIVPRHSEQSALLRFVADKVEDMEMPPLNRREKYPALNADEIARIQRWIDAGAP